MKFATEHTEEFFDDIAEKYFSAFRETHRPRFAQDSKGYLAINDSFISFAETIGKRNSQEDTCLVDQIGLQTTDQATRFFAYAHEEIAKATERTDGGACSISVVITPDGFITVSNAGDSQAVVYIMDNRSGKVTNVQLNTLHSPSDDLEFDRIIFQGGYIRNERVNGSLGVARAFGDHYINLNGNPIITSVPEITRFDLNNYLNPDYKIFVEVSCDGLRLPFYGASDIAALLNTENPAVEAVKSAIAAGSVDNITNYIIRIPSELKKLVNGLFININDGHGGLETAAKVVETIAALNSKLDIASLPEISRDTELREITLSGDITHIQHGKIRREVLRMDETASSTSTSVDSKVVIDPKVVTDVLDSIANNQSPNQSVSSQHR